MVITLDQLALGESGCVERIANAGPVAQRLMAFGILPGCTVKVVAIAPMGDPITIESATGRLSVRKSEAVSVVIGAATETAIGST